MSPRNSFDDGLMLAKNRVEKGMINRSDACFFLVVIHLLDLLYEISSLLIYADTCE